MSLCHSGTSERQPGRAAFFVLENGYPTLRCTAGKETWGFGGASGAVVEMDWGGNVVWQFEPTLHHDHCRLRSDNTLMLAWEVLDAELAKTHPGWRPSADGITLAGP